MQETLIELQQKTGYLKIENEFFFLFFKAI